MGWQSISVRMVKSNVKEKDENSAAYGPYNANVKARSHSLPNAKPAEDAIEKVVRVHRACHGAEFVEGEAQFHR